MHRLKCDRLNGWNLEDQWSGTDKIMSDENYYLKKYARAHTQTNTHTHKHTNTNTHTQVTAPVIPPAPSTTIYPTLVLVLLPLPPQPPSPPRTNTIPATQSPVNKEAHINKSLTPLHTHT